MLTAWLSDVAAWYAAQPWWRWALLGAGLLVWAASLFEGDVYRWWLGRGERYWHGRRR